MPDGVVQFINHSESVEDEASLFSVVIVICVSESESVHSSNSGRENSL